MKAAIYCRVSTTMQEDNYSLPTQEEACRKHAAALGYTVAAVHQDVHSGYELWERPQLTALRQAARSGEIEAIVCFDPDRLSRRQVHYAVLVDEAERHGVELLFVHGQHDKTALGEFLGNVRAFVAEMEREKFRERSMRGVRARIESGKLPPSSRPIYGYRWKDADKGAYDIDDVKAEVVRRMFAMAANGVTLRAITKVLNDEGIPTANGAKEWSFVVISRMLRLEAYMGVAIGNRTITRKVGGKEQSILRPAEEQLILPAGTIPAIVPEDVWQTVQARLARNKAEANRNNRDPEAFLLRAGFVYCGYCGKRIHTAWWRAKSGDLRPSYVIMVNHRGHEDCPTVSMYAPKLDAIVWDKIRGIIMQPDVVAKELARLQQDDPTDADHCAVERALTEIERKRANLSRSLALLDDAEAAAPLVAELKVLAERKRELGAERDTIAARQATWQAAQDRLADLQAWVGIVATNLDGLAYQEKRDLLAALDVKVKLYRHDHAPRYEITASIPLDAAPSENIVLSGGSGSRPWFPASRCDPP